MHTDTKIRGLRELIHEMDEHITRPWIRLPPPVPGPMELHEAFEDDRTPAVQVRPIRKWEFIR